MIQERRGLLAVLAGFTLTAIVAFLVVRSRRNDDAPPPEHFPILPAGRFALHCLPAETNLALGFHVADIIKDKTAACLLVEPRHPWFDWPLEWVRSKIKIGLSDLDHVVLGTNLARKLPAVCMVIRTTMPIHGPIVNDHAEVPALIHRGRNVYRFPVEPLGEVFFWSYDARTLMVMWHPVKVQVQDLETIPSTPSVGAEGIPRPLRNLVISQVKKNSLAWVAGDLDYLGYLQDEFKPWPDLFRKSKALVKVEKLCLCFVSGKELEVHGQFHARSSKGAVVIKSWLDRQNLPTGMSAIVEYGENEIQISDPWNWVYWRLLGNCKTVRTWLEDL